MGLSRHAVVIERARSISRSITAGAQRALIRSTTPAARRSSLASAAVGAIALGVVIWSVANRSVLDAPGGNAPAETTIGADLEDQSASSHAKTASARHEASPRRGSHSRRAVATGAVGFQDVPVSGLAALAPLVRYDGYDANPISLPSVGVKNMPLGLEDLDVESKKRVFVRTIVPLIVAENDRIAADRARLEAILDGAGHTTPADDADWLLSLMAAYRLPDRGPADDDFLRSSLLRRIDEIPVALALAQAAIESAWGTSRFTLEGNALFGEWTFDPKTPGLVPVGREEGATYRVRAFPTLRESVRHYMRNLNCGRAYAEFRTRRWTARKTGRCIDAGTLAETLTSYSERGMAYVDELRAIMVSNEFHRFEDAELAPLDLGLVAELVALASVDAGTAESLLASLTD